MNNGPQGVQTRGKFFRAIPSTTGDKPLRAEGRSESMTYYATRKTVAYGGSVYVVLDKSWGIKAGEMVTIQVDKADAGVTAEEGH